ncbi:MAG: hypothetical protein GEU90_19750 [Gemmatimonas sp.]|nr:hypothetical protein [Gemmatimonas sp.]
MKLWVVTTDGQSFEASTISTKGAGEAIAKAQSIIQFGAIQKLDGEGFAAYPPHMIARVVYQEDNPRQVGFA